MTLRLKLSSFIDHSLYNLRDISNSTGLDVSTLSRIKNDVTCKPKISTVRILENYMDSITFTKNSVIQLALEDIITQNGSVLKASKKIGCSKRSIYRWIHGTIPHPAIRKIILKISSQKIEPK